MPRKRFTNEQIAFALRQAENGATVDEVCEARWAYPSRLVSRWKKQFVGMGVPEIRRLKQLEDENSKLKGLVADLTLDRCQFDRVFTELHTASGLRASSSGRSAPPARD